MRSINKNKIAWFLEKSTWNTSYMVLFKNIYNFWEKIFWMRLRNYCIRVFVCVRYISKYYATSFGMTSLLKDNYS